VVIAVALVGKGASALQSDHHSSKDISLLNAGIGLLTASWVILCLWAGISYMPGQGDISAPAHRQGTIVSETLYFRYRKEVAYTSLTHIATTLGDLFVSIIRHPCVLQPCRPHDSSAVSQPRYRLSGSPRRLELPSRADCNPCFRFRGNVDSECLTYWSEKGREILSRRSFVKHYQK